MILYVKSVHITMQTNEIYELISYLCKIIKYALSPSNETTRVT